MARPRESLDLPGILARVRERLESLNMSAHAASTLAKKPDAIRNLERAIKKNTGRAGISTATIRALATVLETTPAWLLDGTGHDEASAADRLTRAPLISWVSAGNIASPDAVSDIESAPKVFAADLPHGSWIALRVVGASMDRISPPDSIILVNMDETRRVPNACYVIAGVDGEATYKRYRTNPERFEPVSTLDTFDTIFLGENVNPRIVGRVRRTVLDL